MTLLPEDRQKLLADEPAATDHDGLHIGSPWLSPRTGAVIRPGPPTRAACVHSCFLSFSGMTMSVTSAGCSTTDTMRLVLLWRVLFDSVFFQAEDGIRDYKVTGVQTCALPI